MKEDIIKLLKKHTGLKDVQLEIPPNPILGDYAFPCFQLCKKYKLPAHEIAKNLAKELQQVKGISVIEPNGPYLNFFINKQDLINTILPEILTQKSKYGSSKIGKQQKIIIEFSQANTHKAFHVGHLRGTCLGESLARIFEFLDYKVIRANYQGDTGAHVAKWLWYYQKYQKNKTFPKKDVEEYIANIYVNAVKKLTSNPKLQDEVDKINYNLENNKDTKLTSLWKKTRDLSLKEFEKIYKELDTKFDVYFFEREMEQPGKEIVKQLLEKKIAEISDGATIVDLEKYNLGKWVLLRKDGTCLYSAKDLALAKIKFEKYKVKESIYVVGAAQNLHLQQLFKTLELLNFKKPLYHLSFTEVRLPTGKMSSRTGENILYSDMKQELLREAVIQTKQHNSKLSKKEIERISKQTSSAAIKYVMLSQASTKPIIFDHKKALEFEGETGPYLQYTHARICSILKKEKPQAVKEFSSLVSLEEQNLINKLSKFQNVIRKSAKELKVNLLTIYLFELSKTFNEFYHTCSILKATEPLKQERLALALATKITLQNGLNLLAISSPESM
ncbi:MAG: arginine--tRNA ligase [Nanoarchaeota archaeon]|nr:arginine--tRNA ligase [Nanoarchaeota archaeon]